MPAARIAALKSLAAAAFADPHLLDPVGTYAEAVARLLALPGFGPWTAQYWALRALRDSDAFPAARCGAAQKPGRRAQRQAADAEAAARPRGILAAVARLCGATSVGA